MRLSLRLQRDVPFVYCGKTVVNCVVLYDKISCLVKTGIPKDIQIMTLSHKLSRVHGLIQQTVLSIFFMTYSFMFMKGCGRQA